MLSGDVGRLKWEAGLRYETTKVTITDETVDPEDRRSKTDYNLLLPSLNLRYSLTEADRITFSVARTERRPNFNFLSPALLEGEYGDNDFLGNPNLKPETPGARTSASSTASARRGVFGVNVFYRKISNLQEVVNTAPSPRRRSTTTRTPSTTARRRRKPRRS